MSRQERTSFRSDPGSMEGEVERLDSRPPLVVHIVHKLAVGGLENGLTNLINHSPEGQYRHAIVCMTDYTEFAERIKRPDVRFFALRKREGQDAVVYLRLWRLLKSLRPQIVHTRNLGTLECLLPAALAGVKVRIHGEHGRDMMDLEGTNPKHLLLRKLYRPLVTRYVAVSQDLEGWLCNRVGVSPAKVAQIYNGVDTVRFRPRHPREERCSDCRFSENANAIVGTVGRMRGEKDQLTLVRAFIGLRKESGEAGRRLRLVLIGKGPLRNEAESMLREAGLLAGAWLAGERDDVPEQLRAMDIFVLPSLAEGISNTILEAMASGLPVIATEVGGNPELVVPGETGVLVPPADAGAMAIAVKKYLNNAELRTNHGRAGRARVESRFSMGRMVAAYMDLYRNSLNGSTGRETSL